MMEKTLHNSYMSVTVNSLGGQLTSLKGADGLEYLWQGDKAYWSGTAPVLFPICGSIRDDKAVTLDGKELAMPRHGIVRKKEFNLLAESGDSVSFFIKPDDAMKQQYPYDFRLVTSYTIKENTLTAAFTVCNQGKERMPFLAGGHPGFNCPLYEGEQYSDYYLEFEETETLTVPEPVTETGLININHRTPFMNNTNTVRLDHALFAKDAVILDTLKSRSVTLKCDKNDKHLTLGFEQFPYLILWSTANQGPFIALEPWLGLSTCDDEDDVFEHKRNMQYCEAGEEKTYAFTITL